MLNGRNEGKYEGSDDSEYHFSDDEVHYDTESDAAPKQASVSDLHGGAASGSSGSMKRMGIGLAVFFVLVFVAYKMVSPGASTPATDITPQTAPVAAAAPAAQPQSMQQQTAPAVQQAAAPAPQAAMQQPQQVAAQQVTQQPAQQAAPQQQAVQQPSSQPQTAIQQMQQMPVASQEVTANQQPVQAGPEQMQAQVQAPQQNAPQAAAPQQQSTVMQEVIPVQSVATAPQNTVSSVTPAQTIQQAAGESSLATENARLSGQLQAEYAQRINEYQNQNKNLQDQVQTLNGRVASMESEMNQLIQTLTQQFQTGGTPGVAPQAQQPQVQAQAQQGAFVEQAGPPPRIPYNVQAIIPGRAWLRSNNGDTLTVAEGDEIKGIGRVTKIDPYDGVVEINVQGRPVTLSYGNGS